MIVVVDKTPARTREDTADHGRLLHVYPCLLDGREPQMGDVALCGHVKKKPTQVPFTERPGDQHCVVCDDLADGLGL